MSGLIRVVIPAAGEGKRFKDAGYSDAKHLIPVLGKPMIEQVVASLKVPQPYRLQVLTQESIGHKTKGAVDTILQADIDNSPLLIANCDQLVDLNFDDFTNKPCDGVVATFRSQSPHHSYVEVEEGVIKSIKEKEVISDQAVAGVYFFHNGLSFRQAAEEVMHQGIKYKGEYYLSSVLAFMIKQGYMLTAYECPVAILGTPEDLQRFEVAVKVWRKL